jgi:hypothetical protein
VPNVKLHELIYDMPSEEYHSTEGTYSSSQFKDIIEDEELFIQKYIHKSIEREQIEAFDVGSYFHTGILEPHKLKEDCVVYPKAVRRGEHWEAFQKKHKGKTIVTKSMMEKAEGLIEAVKKSPVAMSYVKRGVPEVSLFVKLAVSEGEIYAPYFWKRLTPSGWVKDKPPKGGEEIIVKVRADSLGNNYILDLKSTSGNAKSPAVVLDKNKTYKYDLSAALYMDLFNLPLEGAISKFLWTYASKDKLNSKTWVATSENIYVGRKKYVKAIHTFMACKRNGFELYDSLGEIGPHYSDMHYLREKDSDLL